MQPYIFFNILLQCTTNRIHIIFLSEMIVCVSVIRLPKQIGIRNLRGNLHQCDACLLLSLLLHGTADRSKQSWSVGRSVVRSFIYFVYFSSSGQSQTNSNHILNTSIFLFCIFLQEMMKRMQCIIFLPKYLSVCLYLHFDF